MTEFFSNLGQTTINQIGGISATATTVTVASLTNGIGNSFPSSGNFRLIFGNDVTSEIVLCTAVDPVNKILTIIRGQEGSLPRAWVNGTAVTVGLTAQAVNQMRADLLSVGPYSARPPQGLPTGSFYYATDGHTPWVWDPFVGAWRPQINGVLGFQPPPASQFSIGVNQGTATLVDSGKGALDFTDVGDGANTINYHGYFFPWQGGPLVVEACVSIQTYLNFPGSTWISLGPSLRESSTGKLCFFGQSITLSSGVPYLEMDIYANPTSRTSNFSTNSTFEPSQPHFVRLRYDGRNIYSEASRDRLVWWTTTTTAVGSIFTNGPDQIGFGGFSAGVAGFCHILSYQYGPIATIQDTAITPPPQQLPPPPPAVTPPTGWRSAILNR